MIVADEVVGVDQHRLVAEWDQNWELIVLELVHRRLLIDQLYHISVDLLKWRLLARSSIKFSFI